MQLGTRVKLTDESLEKKIRKHLNGDGELRFAWIKYLSSLYGVEGNIDGFYPGEEPPPGTLIIKWDAEDKTWDDYFNEAEEGGAPYGWFEDELVVVE